MKFMNIPFFCVAYKTEQWSVTNEICVIWRDFEVVHFCSLRRNSEAQKFNNRLVIKISSGWNHQTDVLTMHLSRVVLAISCVLLQIIPEVSCGKFSSLVFWFVKDWFVSRLIFSEARILGILESSPSFTLHANYVRYWITFLVIPK